MWRGSSCGLAACRGMRWLPSPLEARSAAHGLRHRWLGLEGWPSQRQNTGAHTSAEHVVADAAPLHICAGPKPTGCGSERCRGIYLPAFEQDNVCLVTGVQGDQSCGAGRETRQGRVRHLAASNPPLLPMPMQGRVADAATVELVTNRGRTAACSRVRGNRFRPCCCRWVPAGSALSRSRAVPVMRGRLGRARRSRAVGRPRRGAVCGRGSSGATARRRPPCSARGTERGRLWPVR